MQQTGIRRELEAAQKAAGASLRPVVDWHSINWKQANRNVRRLQSRIVQAGYRVHRSGRLKGLS